MKSEEDRETTEGLLANAMRTLPGYGGWDYDVEKSMAYSLAAIAHVLVKGVIDTSNDG